MSTSTVFTLADRVYEVLSLEDRKAVDASSTYPVMPDEEYLTTFELDCRDWGLVFGVAYGIARGEDPYESPGSVGVRALEAAEAAWTRYAESPGTDASILNESGYWRSRAGDRPKSLGDVLKPLMDAYDDAHRPDGRYSATPVMTDALKAELDNLSGVHS